MRRIRILLPAAGSMLGWIFTGCSVPARRETPVARSEVSGASITQFYATVPQLARGEKSLICYGVENTRTVWLAPPRHELSAALTRCVEVTPETDTTYTLTAEGLDGSPVTRELKIAVGAGRARIGNVTVSALEVKPGDLVSICYEVSNARTVTIDPVHYRKDAARKGCATDQPRKSTTYVITAAGSGADRDVERVTVKVR